MIAQLRYSSMKCHSDPYLLIILMVLCLSGCRKNQDVLFEIPLQLDFQISPGLSPFEKHFYLVSSVPTNLTELKEQFGVTQDQDLILRPGSAVLSSFLQNVDFNFVEEVTISVYDEDKDDALDLFFNNQIPFSAGKNVLINPIDQDVRAEIDKDQLNFKVGMRFRSITPISIECNVDIVFTAE